MSTRVVPPAIAAAACASQARWDIPASVCLAQWALESGWGRFMPPGSNNPFGIKAGPDQPFVEAMTRERLNGVDVRLPQRFRRFASIDEAFDMHGKLLATGTPYAAARAVRHDAKAFARALQGHYATDPDYASELIGVMDAANLTRFDRMSAGSTPDIAGLQSALNQLGARPCLVVDGEFGGRTREAVRAFQGRHGLFQDGELTPATLHAIAQAVSAENL